MRRWLVPVLLAVLTASAGTLALGLPGPRVAGPEATPRLQVPVLSARRVPAVVSGVVADARLRTSLEATMASPGLGGARSRSCLVVRQGARPVIEWQPGQSLIPASTAKVLTGQAVLDKLGQAERLVTEVRVDRPLVAGGVVEGNLWLVGGGDPLLATADYAASFPHQPQLRTAMEGLADAVVAGGVRQVRGAVIGDETRYDSQRYVATWKPSYVTSGQVGPVSALSVNDGFMAIRHTPAPEPDVQAAAVLTALLRARGVLVGGHPGQGTAPVGAAVVARVASPPMHEVVGQMLRESDNNTAELLVKELGVRFAQQGSTRAGLRVMRDALAAAGLPAQDLMAVDGSGLDRSDRVSCRLLTAVLERSGPSSPLAAGFPVAARDGTLSRRFHGNPAAGRLRAKTGSLEGVAGLAGYIDVPGGGGPLAFALLANDLPGEAAGRSLQEQVGALLARYPEAPPPAVLGP